MIMDSGYLFLHNHYILFMGIIYINKKYSFLFVFINEVLISCFYCKSSLSAYNFRNLFLLISKLNRHIFC